MGVCLSFQAIEDELNSRRAHLEDVLQVGRDLIDAGNFGSEQISSRIKDIDEQWKGLMGLANYRRQRLQDSLNFYQVCCLLRRFSQKGSV